MSDDLEPNRGAGRIRLIVADDLDGLQVKLDKARREPP